MILIDANLLLYAYDEDNPYHTAAKPWLRGILTGTEPVGLSWVTILAFIRISTHKKIFPNAFSVEEATAIVEEWLELPCMSVLGPGTEYWSILHRLLREHQVHGPLVMDAHLAALAIEVGGTLYSSDTDFKRFAGLRWVNPLEE